eukprot:4339156-Pleurochrysis_carterae.AAC.1
MPLRQHAHDLAQGIHAPHTHRLPSINFAHARTKAALPSRADPFAATGEQCNYAGYAPEQWLAEVSGVPFGLQGQILGNNRDQWQGLVFGMTCRIYPEPHTCNPRPLYAVFDDLGFKQPRMIGWWDAACPVRSPDERVRATLFLSATRVFAVAVASWADEPLSLSLTFDLEALAVLGFTPAASTAKLRARAISGFQPAGEWSLHQQFEIQPKGSGFNEGWFFELV